MKEHTYAFQNADTRPRLQSRTQNICFVISISAVILKQMVKITSIFRSFVYPPCCGVEEQMLIFSSGLTPGRVKRLLN